MKYLSRLLFVTVAALGLAACNDGADFIGPNGAQPGDIPVSISFSFADKAKPTRSKVSGTENVVHTMQLVCFDANGLYLGIRNAGVTSNGASGQFFDTGVINGTVPQGTSRIHFIANRNLDVPLSHNVGTDEATVMNSMELSTLYNDEAHQEICYWGYHQEANAEAMSSWLKPAEGTHNTVYLIRDRAKVVFQYDPTGASVPVTKIEWLIHNGRERGYLAPAQTNWTNTGYYANSTVEGQTDKIVSVAGMHEYTGGNRYSLWVSETENDDAKFDVAYQQGSDTSLPQYLFDDDNANIDNVKVILKVTYTVGGSSETVYHVLRLNDNNGNLYDIVRNNTYYINAKLLTPDIGAYETLKEAIDGEEFINAETEIDRTIPDINNDQYTLQIKLPTETTSIVLNTEGPHQLDYVFRLISDVNTSGSTDPDDFEVKWEKSQTFCSESLPVSYIPATKQFQITANVIAGQLTSQLQDEWIVVKHKATGLTRYIHVFVIDQFRYRIEPKLTRVGTTDDYVLHFQIPPMEHTKFKEDGSPDPTELVYPESLYPIDVKFTTNTLNAYGITQGTTNYGLFGVSIEPTTPLTVSSNFETGYATPVSTFDTGSINQWYFQQATKPWDFWYTYQLKTCPGDLNGDGNVGDVYIYFKDIRDHIKYATVQNVGLFLYVEYFGKNYSVPLSAN